MYLEDGTLSVVTLGRGYAWLDTGTMESLRGAGEFRVLSSAVKTSPCVPEEIAWENGWIDTDKLPRVREALGQSVYGQHLKRAAEGEFVNRRDH